MIAWIKGIFKKYDLIAVFVLSTIIGLALYAFPQTREFGVNVITELGSIWITVLLINRMIEKRERKKRLFIDQRILTETLSIIASYYSIWKHLVWQYSPSAKIQEENDLIKLYPELLKTAQLSAAFDIVSIHDPESWKLFFHNRTISECLENYMATVQGQIRSLIDNFKTHLEPQLLGQLLEINESKYFMEISAVFRKDEAEVLDEFGQDVDRLGSYLSTDISHFKKVSELQDYCRGLRDRIAEFTAMPPETYNIKDYFKNPMQEYPMHMFNK